MSRLYFDRCLKCNVIRCLDKTENEFYFAQLQIYPSQLLNNQRIRYNNPCYSQFSVVKSQVAHPHQIISNPQEIYSTCLPDWWPVYSTDPNLWLLVVNSTSSQNVFSTRSLFPPICVALYHTHDRCVRDVRIDLEQMQSLLRVVRISSIRSLVTALVDWTSGKCSSLSVEIYLKLFNKLERLQFSI